MRFCSCFIGVVLRGRPSVFVYLATDRSQDRDDVSSATLVTAVIITLSNESGVVWTTAKVTNIWPLAFSTQRVATCANVANQPLASMSSQESVRPSDETEAFYLHCRAAYLAVLGSSLTNISSKQQLCQGKKTVPCFTDTVGWWKSMRNVASFSRVNTRSMIW